MSQELPVRVENEKEVANFPWGGTATRFVVGDTTWWLWKSFVPELSRYMWALYGHSRSSGYVGQGSIQVVGPEGRRIIREAPSPVPSNHGPDVWYADTCNSLITQVKDSSC